MTPNQARLFLIGGSLIIAGVSHHLNLLNRYKALEDLSERQFRMLTYFAKMIDDSEIELDEFDEIVLNNLLQNKERSP